MIPKRPATSIDPDRPSGASSAAWASPTRILSWVYIGRAILAAVLLFRFPAFALDLPVGAGYALTLLLATGVFTAASYLYSHSRGGAPAGAFLYAQVIFDALLLTAIVFVTGAQYSMFAPLYILVISAGALLLPIVGGILVGLLTSILYFAAAVGSTGSIDRAILLQAALFAVVALVTGYLGDRLRQTGAALGEVQTELRRLRLDTNDILETIGTGILTVDQYGRLAYLNPAAAEILSLRPSDWLDRPIFAELDRIAPGLGEVIERTAASATPIRRFETAPLADDSFILGVSTTLLERVNEERPPVTAIFQDITERKRVEGLRRRAERLEAVAELSASLAHEIKNPLASIRSAVEQIAGAEVEPEDGRILSNLIVRESDRLSRLLGEFIDFARVKVNEPQPIDLTRLVHDVVDVVRAHPDARERAVSVLFEGPAEPLFIRGAEDLLHRAVLNLALNAAQWAGPRGRVVLSVGEVRSDLLSSALGALRLVRLEVRDTGPGVPEEIRDHIFDPFFTRRQGGTGLGLALVQRAVEAHGGAIFVDNAHLPAGGAVFSLYLPALQRDGDIELAGLPAIQALKP